MATASAENNVSKYYLWKKKPNFCKEKSSFPNRFREIFSFNLIKQNETHFSFNF